MRRNFRDDAGIAPVKVGEELDVKIEGVGEKGDGIAKKDGFVLFVPNVKIGDEVKVRITRVLRKVGFAEVVGAGSTEGEAKEEEAPKEEGEAKTSSEPEGESKEYEDTEDFGEENK